MVWYSVNGYSFECSHLKKTKRICKVTKSECPHYKPKNSQEYDNPGNCGICRKEYLKWIYDQAQLAKEGEREALNEFC